MAADETNLNAVINVRGNFSGVTQQLSGLTSQIARLNAALLQSDAAAQDFKRSAFSAFKNGEMAGSGYTSQLVKLTSETEHFGKALDRQKLSLKESSKALTGYYTGRSRQIQNLAREQAKLNRSFLVELGRDAGGARSGALFTQTATNAGDMGMAAEVAAQKMSVLRGVMTNFNTALTNWGKNTQWAGRQLTVGLTVPLSIFAATAAKSFIEVDKELTRFKRVYGDAFTTSAETAKAVKAVQKTSQELAQGFGVSAKETAGLASDLAAAGYTGQKLQGALEQTSKIAILGEVDRQDALKTTLALQSAFNQNTQELAESVNFLNAVENQTSTSLQDLTTAIPKAGPVINSLGGDVKDLAVLLVALKEGGVSASEGANAIKSGIGSIVNPAKSAIEFLAKFNINLSEVSKTATTDVVGGFVQLAQQLDNLSAQDKTQAIYKIFGKQQASRISALLQNIAKDGSQAQTAIQLAGSATSELAGLADKELTQYAEASSTRFKAAWESISTALLPVGEELVKVIVPALNAAYSAIVKFTDFISNAPDWVKNLVKVGAAAVFIAGPFIQLVGTLANLGGYIGKLGTGLFVLIRSIFGLKTDKFEYLTKDIMASRLATDELTTSYLSQKEALRIVNSQLAIYLAQLKESALLTPGLYDEAQLLAIQNGNDPGAKRRGRRRTARPIRRSIGGTVPGVGTGDKVPAMLEPGEFVVRRSAVSRIGLDVLNNINAGNTKKFANGGYVPPTPQRPQDVAQASDFFVTDNFGIYIDKLTNQRLKPSSQGAEPKDMFKAFSEGGAAPWSPLMSQFGLPPDVAALSDLAPAQAAAMARITDSSTDVIGSFETLSKELEMFYGSKGPLQNTAKVFDKVDEGLKKRYNITEPGQGGIYQGTSGGQPIQVVSNAEVMSGAIERTRSKIKGKPAQLKAFDDLISESQSSLFLGTDAKWARKKDVPIDPDTGERFLDKEGKKMPRVGGFQDPLLPPQEIGKEFSGRGRITPYGRDYAGSHPKGIQELAERVAKQTKKDQFSIKGMQFAHMGASSPMTEGAFSLLRNKLSLKRGQPGAVEIPALTSKILGGTAEQVNEVSDAARIKARKGMGDAGLSAGDAFIDELRRELEITSPSRKGKKIASDFVDGMEQGIPEAGRAGKQTGAAYVGGAQSEVKKGGKGVAANLDLTGTSSVRSGLKRGMQNAATGASLGAEVGSVIPGVGTAVGAAVGGGGALATTGVVETGARIRRRFRLRASGKRRKPKGGPVVITNTDAADFEQDDMYGSGEGGVPPRNGRGGTPPNEDDNNRRSRKEARAEAKRFKNANRMGGRGRMAVGGAAAMAGTALMFGAGESLGMSSGTSQIAGLGLTMLPSLLGSIPGPAGAAVVALAAVAAGIGYFVYKSNQSVKKLRDQAENQFKTPDKLAKSFGIETKGAAFQRDRIQSGLGPTLTENQVKSIRTDYQGTIEKLRTASTNELSNTLGDVYANLLSKGFGKAQAESILNEIAEQAGKKSIAVDIIANIIGVTGSSGNAALDAARARTEGFSRQSQSLSTSAERFQSGGYVFNSATGKYDQGDPIAAQRASDPLKLFYQNKNELGQQNGILSTVKSVLFGPGGGNPFSSKIWDAAGVSMAEKLGAAVSSIPVFGAVPGLINAVIGLNRANNTDKTNIQQGTDPKVFTAQAGQYAGNVITDQNLSTGARYAALGYAGTQAKTFNIPGPPEVVPNPDPLGPDLNMPSRTSTPYTLSPSQPDTGILGKVNETAGRQVDDKGAFKGYENQEVATKYIDNLAKQYDETNPGLAAYIRLQKDANVATAAVQLSMAGLDYALANTYTPEQLKSVGAYYNEIEQGEQMMAAQEAALAKGIETAKAAVQAGAQQKIDAIDDEIKALEKRKKKINEGLEAQRDADSEAIDAIEKRNEKLKESLDKQLKPLEAQKKALADARDATLKLLDAEQRRETFAETMKRSQIDLATAISSGDMVSAAKIQSEMDAANSANAKENARTSINDSTTAQLDEIEKKEKSIKDAIQGQIDANNKKIRGIQDAAEAREKAARREIKAIDNTIEKERERQQSIRDTATAAIKALDDIAKDDKTTFEQKIAKVNGVLNDTKGIAKVIDSKKIMSTFTSGVYTSIKDALPVITESLGLSSDPSSTTAQNQFLKGVEDAFKANGISVNHGGGEIGAAPRSGMKGNRAGRSMSAPLYRDEVPALLQRGEFVIQKNAVNKIGVDKLNEINAGVYHSGGPVGHDHAGGALTASAAAVGGASMVTGLVARGAGRGIVNSLYPQIKDSFTKYIKGYTSGANNASSYIVPSDGAAPNDDVSTYTMKGDIGSVSKAISFLYGQIESGSTAWKQLCEKLARTAYGLPGMFPSALAHFRAIPANKKRNRDAEGAPTGALGFWNTGPYGHIAVSTGNGSFFTNLSDGTVGIKSASQLANWGPLMGVTEPWWSNKNYIDIPGLAVGGEIMKDNVLANLHNGEVVLTKSLSADLKTGITRMADTSNTSQPNQVENNFNIQITGSDQKTAEQISWEVIRKIEQRERQNNGRRTI
jgi:TP901 family phage tail tape measure protein